MNRAETARVLAKAAAYDQRTVGEADVLAWHEILERVDLTDALDAVRRHYTASVERIMPADVVRLARDARRDRERAQPDAHAEVLALPSRYEPDIARDIRVREGVARCRDVMTPIWDALRARRQAADPLGTTGCRPTDHPSGHCHRCQHTA